MKGDGIIKEVSLEPEFSKIDQENIIMLATQSFKLSYNDELDYVVYDDGEGLVSIDVSDDSQITRKKEDF